MTGFLRATFTDHIGEKFALCGNSNTQSSAHNAQLPDAD